MKIVYYVSRDKKRKLTELFGLSRSGKSTLALELVKRGDFDRVVCSQENKFFVLMRFLQYFIKNPIRTTKLFFYLNSNVILIESLTFIKKLRILIMRNSYLASVLSKSELSNRLDENLLVDEFFLQLTFIILQKKSSERKIRKLMKLFELPEKIILVEESKSKRYERFRAHRFPGGHIDKNYSLEWMKNQEYNYRILKRIIAQNYNKIKN
jgi:hypothetical protein